MLFLISLFTTATSVENEYSVFIFDEENIYYRDGDYVEFELHVFYKNMYIDLEQTEATLGNYDFNNLIEIDWPSSKIDTGIYRFGFFIDAEDYASYDGDVLYLTLTVKCSFGNENEYVAKDTSSLTIVFEKEDEDETDVDNDGYSVEGGDCNDDDSSINPGQYDIPENGIDEDCSGNDALLETDFKAEMYTDRTVFQPGTTLNMTTFFTNNSEPIDPTDYTLTTTSLRHESKYFVQKGDIAYWSFNEESETLIDESGSENNLNSQSSNSWTNQGIIDSNAIQFSGDSAGAWADGATTNLALESDYTLSIWLWPSTIPSSYQGRAFSRGSDGYGYELLLNADEKFEYRSCRGSFTFHQQVNTLEWYHVAIVYNQKSGLLKSYLNGVMDKEVSAESTQYDCSADYNFVLGGKWWSTSQDKWQGRMDEFSIFSRSLTDEEIANIHNPRQFISEEFIYSDIPTSVDLQRLSKGVFYFQYNIPHNQNSDETIVFTLTSNLETHTFENQLQVQIRVLEIWRKTFDYTIEDLDLEITKKESLVYLKMDEIDSETSIIRDFSGNENHAKIVGPLSLKNGNFQKSVALKNSESDEEQYLLLPDLNNNNSFQSLTVEVWFFSNMECNDCNEWDGGILYGGGNNGDIRLRDFGNGTIKAEAQIIKYDGSEAEYITVYSSISYDIGWNHVVMTYKECGSMSIYINGEFAGQTNAWPSGDCWYWELYDRQGGDFGRTSEGNYIGITSWGSSLFDGRIDDLSIWNKVLTENQIKFLYTDRLVESRIVANVSQTHTLYFSDHLGNQQENLGIGISIYFDEKLIEQNYTETDNEGKLVVEIKFPVYSEYSYLPVRYEFYTFGPATIVDYTLSIPFLAPEENLYNTPSSGFSIVGKKDNAVFRGEINELSFRLHYNEAPLELNEVIIFLVDNNYQISDFSNPDDAFLSKQILTTNNEGELEIEFTAPSTCSSLTFYFKTPIPPYKDEKDKYVQTTKQYSCTSKQDSVEPQFIPDLDIKIDIDNFENPRPFSLETSKSDTHACLDISYYVIPLKNYETFNMLNLWGFTDFRPLVVNELIGKEPAVTSELKLEIYLPENMNEEPYFLIYTECNSYSANNIIVDNTGNILVENILITDEEQEIEEKEEEKEEEKSNNSTKESKNPDSQITESDSNSYSIISLVLILIYLSTALKNKRN